MRHHPDRAGSEACASKFSAITASYEAILRARAGRGADSPASGSKWTVRQRTERRAQAEKPRKNDKYGHLHPKEAQIKRGEDWMQEIMANKDAHFRRVQRGLKRARDHDAAFRASLQQASREVSRSSRKLWVGSGNGGKQGKAGYYKETRVGEQRMEDGNRVMTTTWFITTPDGLEQVFKEETRPGFGGRKRSKTIIDTRSDRTRLALSLSEGSELLKWDQLVKASQEFGGVTVASIEARKFVNRIKGRWKD
ncbi:unnamed protein product [Chrysoparadoxa australica]